MTMGAVFTESILNYKSEYTLRKVGMQVSCDIYLQVACKIIFLYLFLLLQTFCDKHVYFVIGKNIKNAKKKSVHSHLRSLLLLLILLALSAKPVYKLSISCQKAKWSSKQVPNDIWIPGSYLPLPGHMISDKLYLKLQFPLLYNLDNIYIYWIWAQCDH